MKLNLLPTSVGRESKGRFATFVAIAIAGAGIFSFFYQKSNSERFIEEQTARKDRAVKQAEDAVKYVAAANQILQDNRGVILNANLAEAMSKHSVVYPNLYDEVKGYVPAWFRVTSMNATAGGADATVVRIQGVIKTQEQYADLMLAFLRMPNVVNVTRNGFVYDNPRVPAISTADQVGRRKKVGDPTIPDDPLDRLELQIASATSTGFTGAGNFGLTNTTQRGAMPGWANVTVDILIRKNIQSPDPIPAVLSTGGMWPKVDFAAGAAPATTGAPAAPKTNTPGGGN